MPNYTNFKAEFATEFPGELSPKQLWLLTKFAKNVRLRCRNNAAFNNFMNATFPYARFQQVTKQRADGSSYPGLSITVKTKLPGSNLEVSQEISEDNED